MYKIIITLIFLAIPHFLVADEVLSENEKLVMELRDSDFDRSKEIIRILSDKPQVAQLIIEQLDQEPSLGLGMAIMVLSNDITVPLIENLDNEKYQQNAAFYLKRLGILALPSLKTYTSNTKYSRIVSQIIEIINKEDNKTYLEIFMGRKKREKENLKFLLQASHSGGISKYLISKDEKHIITLGVDNVIKKWELESEKLQWEYRFGRTKADDIFYLSKKNWIVVTSLGTMIFINLNSGRVEREIQLEDRFKNIKSSSDEKYLLGFTGGNTVLGINAYDIISNKIIPIEQQTREQSDSVSENEINFFHASFFARFVKDSHIISYGNAPTFAWEHSLGMTKNSYSVNKLFNVSKNIILKGKNVTDNKFLYSPKTIYSQLETYKAQINNKNINLKKIDDDGKYSTIKRIQREKDIDSIYFTNNDFLVLNYSNTNDKKTTTAINLKNLKETLIVRDQASRYEPNIYLSQNSNFYFVLHDDVNLLKKYDSKSGNLITSFDSASEGITAIDINDAETLVAVAYERTNGVTIWDIKEANPSYTVSAFKKGIRNLLFIPNSTSILLVTDSGTLERWNYITNKIEKIWTGIFLRERTLSISSKGYVALRGNRIKEINISQPLEKIKKEINNNLFTVQKMTRLGRLLTIPSIYLDISILDINTGRTISVLEDYRYDVSGILFLKNNKDILLGGPGWYGKWNVLSGKKYFTHGVSKQTIAGYSSDEKSRIKSVTINYNNELYLDFTESINNSEACAVTSKNKITCFNINTGKPEWVVDYQTLGDISWANAILHHPNEPKLITVHSDGIIRVWNSKNGHLIDQFENTGTELTDAIITSNGQSIFTSGMDSILKLASIRKKEYSLSLAMFNNREWSIFSRNGYFTSSLEGGDYASWKTKGEVFRFSRFSEIFLDRERIKKIILNPDCCDFSKIIVEVPPSIINVSHSTIKDNGITTLNINTTSPISNLVIKNNGRIQFNGNTDQLGLKNTYTFDLTLDQRYNQITIIGKNKDNLLTSIKHLQIINPNNINKPTLYFLGLGIDNFNTYETLWHPTSDVRMLEKIFGSQKKTAGWSSVEIESLTEHQMTNKNIKLKLKALRKKVRPNDVVIVYLGTHGITDLFNKNKLLIITKGEDEKDSDIEVTELVSIIDSIKSNVLFLIDVCHAGTTQRNFKPLTTDILSQRILNDNSGNKILFFSSKEREVAIEYTSMKNSSFIGSISNALSGEADVQPKDNVITLRELYQYVQRNTLSITNGQQTPYIPFIEQHPNIPLFYY